MEYVGILGSLLRHRTFSIVFDGGVVREEDTVAFVRCHFVVQFLFPLILRFQLLVRVV